MLDFVIFESFRYFDKSAVFICKGESDFQRAP